MSAMSLSDGKDNEETDGRREQESITIPLVSKCVELRLYKERSLEQPLGEDPKRLFV